MNSCNKRRRRRTGSGSDSHTVEPVYWYSIFSLLSFGKKIVKRIRTADSVPIEPVRQSSISGDERTADSVPVEPSHWSSIPGDILCIIAGKIGSVDDYVRLCAVCRYWYSTATGFYNLNRNHLRFGPLLVMSGPNPKSTRVTLRNPSSDATFLLELPVGPKTLRWGSPFSWLVSYDPVDLRLDLLNPFTGATIPLPRSRSGSGNPYPFRSQDPHKVFLTADPNSDPENCLVIVSSGSGDLSFVKPVGLTREWYHIEGGSNLHDVASFRGELYGIQSPGHRLELVSFQLNHREANGQISHRLIKTLTLDTTPDPVYSLGKHIVEIDGDLCLCVRYPAPVYKIFKIDIPNGTFTQILSLAEHCLFLGQGYSFACKASYSPGEFFQRPRRQEPREFASNYVFYKWNERRLNIDVWDVSSSEMAWATRDWLEGSFPPLWIVPFIKFRKLEEDGL